MEDGIMKTIAVLFLNIALATPPAFAASYRSVARTLAMAAHRADIERVAVLPFSPLDGSAPGEGKIIAERITNRIAAGGRVGVVERSRLVEVMGEHQLGMTGALNTQKLAKIGGLLQARAVVVGSFVTFGSKVELHARLVNIETGEVLAARTTETDRDWFGYSTDVIPAPAPIGIEDAISDVLLFQRGERLPPKLRKRSRPETIFSIDTRDLRDAPAPRPDPRRIAQLQASVVELKARHWAAQIHRKKLDFTETFSRTAAGMSPTLRTRYAELLRDAWIWGSKPLTPLEIKKFVAADAAAFTLRARMSAGQRILR